MLEFRSWQRYPSNRYFLLGQEMVLLYPEHSFRAFFEVSNWHSLILQALSSEPVFERGLESAFSKEYPLQLLRIQKQFLTYLHGEDFTEMM